MSEEYFLDGASGSDRADLYRNVETNSTFHCIKHGEYTVPTPSADFGNIQQQFSFQPCPRCTEVKEQGLCQECEKHKGTVTFSNDMMSFVHGMYEKICKCCHFARVAKTLINVQENYNILKAELETTPCAE